jgi:ABC-type branched-subunit amino acid transport system substrate-binding protein
MNRIKILFFGSAIFFTIFVFSLYICKFAVAKGGNALNQGSVIRIAMVMPVEGRYAFFGKQFVNGMLLSLKKSGASKVKFIIVNLSLSAGKTNIYDLFKSLSKKDVSAIIGPLFAGQLKYFAKYSDEFKIPVITPSPVVAKKDLSHYVFGYGMTLKQEIKTDMKYAYKHGIKSVSVIYPYYGYGPLTLRYIAFYAKKYGITLLNKTAYNKNTVDFFNNFDNIVIFNAITDRNVTAAERAELGVTKYDLMNGITKSKPNIPFGGLFVLGGKSKLELILTQLVYYNITGFPLFTLSSIDSRRFMEKNSFYMENSFFPDGFFKYARNEIVKKFSSAYKKSYGKAPNILSAEGYDIGKIVIKAAALSSKAADLNLSNRQNAYKGVNFYKAILKVKKIKGVCGVINLKNNIFHKSLYLFNYKNGKIYILKNPLG